VVTWRAMAEEALRKILVYRTATRVYLFSRTKDRNAWRVLKFSRDSDPTELDAVADKTVYTEKECKSLLKQINDGNLQHGGLKFVCAVRPETLRWHMGRTVHESRLV
jgi:hypothetical protein